MKLTKKLAEVYALACCVRLSVKKLLQKHLQTLSLEVTPLTWSVSPLFAVLLYSNNFPKSLFCHLEVYSVKCSLLTGCGQSYPTDDPQKS